MSSISLDETDVRSGRYQVLLFLCLSAMVAYIQRAALSVPASEIAADLQFADLARDMGWIQSAWYLAYGLMQIPSGWFADRLGSRRALAIFSVVWSLATLLTAFANDFQSLLVLWSVMGLPKQVRFRAQPKRWGEFFPTRSEPARPDGWPVEWRLEAHSRPHWPLDSCSGSRHWRNPWMWTGETSTGSVCDPGIFSGQWCSSL